MHGDRLRRPGRIVKHSPLYNALGKRSAGDDGNSGIRKHDARLKDGREDRCH